MDLLSATHPEQQALGRLRAQVDGISDREQVRQAVARYLQVEGS